MFPWSRRGCVLKPLTFHALEMFLFSGACGRGLAEVLGLLEPCRTALMGWSYFLWDTPALNTPYGALTWDAAEQGTLPGVETWDTLHGTPCMGHSMVGTL